MAGDRELPADDTLTTLRMLRRQMEQLVFEWNAPPDYPVIRKLRTLVYLDFKPLPGNRTELTLRNFGYGDGPDWAKNKAYFEKAWPSVMANLEKKYAAAK